MAIRRDYRDIRTIVGLGALAGMAETERIEKQRAAAVQEQLRREKHEKEMAEFRAQLDVDATQRAQMWEIEKMQIRSRLDFEREEMERIRELDRIDGALKQIDREVESGRITETQAAPLRFSYEMKKYGVDTPVSLIRPPREQEQVPTKRTDVDAAIKFLQEYEEKKKKAAQWYSPFAPEPTTEEDIAAEYYRGVLKTVEPTIADIDIEPSSEQEFYAIVGQLKTVDPAKAKAYYDKWSTKW